MSALDVVVLVLSILAAVAVLFALVWVPIAGRLRGLVDELTREIEASGERVILGPEQASFRGATDVHGRVKGVGVVVLTDRRLLFRKVLGKPIEIPVDQIAGVRTNKWFLRAYGSGGPVVILTTRSGLEVGFTFVDAEAWAAQLRRLESGGAPTTSA